jgi:hypothetical protein
MLPTVASAFSFDSRAAAGITPSVQVLSQALALSSGECPLTYMLALSCSYLLLPQSVLLLNVRPLVTDNIVVNCKLDSLFSDLLSSILKLQARYYRSRVEIYKIGTESIAAVDSAVDCTPPEIKAMRSIVTYEIQHPAAVARMGDKATMKLKEKDKLEAERWFQELLQVQAEIRSQIPHISHGAYLRNRRVNEWRLYSEDKLALLGKASVMRRLATILRLPTPSESLLKLKAQIKILNMSFMRNKYKSQTSWKDSQEALNTHLEIQLNYISEATAQARKQFDEAITTFKDYMVVNPTVNTDERVKEVLDRLLAVEDSFRYHMAVFKSSIYALSQAAPAVSMGGSKVAPIIKISTKADLYVSSDEETGFGTSRLKRTSLKARTSALNLDFLGDIKRSDVESRNAAKGEAKPGTSRTHTPSIASEMEEVVEPKQTRKKALKSDSGSSRTLKKKSKSRSELKDKQKLSGHVNSQAAYRTHTGAGDGAESEQEEENYNDTSMFMMPVDDTLSLAALSAAFNASKSTASGKTKKSKAKKSTKEK